VVAVVVVAVVVAAADSKLRLITRNLIKSSSSFLNGKLLFCCNFS